MSPVSSMVPPPLQVPAMAANGCAASGLGSEACTTGSFGISTAPSGLSARAAGTNAEITTNAAKPRMMLVFIVTPRLAPLVTFIGRAVRGSGSPHAGHNKCSLILWRHEHIAHSAHGANGIRMGRIDLDLLAQPRNPQVDGAVEGLHLAMGGGFQQPVALQRP